MTREAKYAFAALLALSIGANVATLCLAGWLVTRPSPPTIDPAVQLCRVVKP